MNSVEIDAQALAVNVAPLDDAERRWIGRLERVLRAMPRRLLLVECADGLLLVDRAAAADVDLYDGRAQGNGVLLAHVAYSVGKCTGVSG